MHSTPTLVVASVKAIESASGTLVYNLEVEDDHTYFVGNVAGGAWVHNACRARPDSVTIPTGNDNGEWIHIEGKHITGYRPNPAVHGHATNLDYFWNSR